MPQSVEIEGIGTVDFPDEMSRVDITDRIKNQIIPKYRNSKPADSIPTVAPTQDPNIPEPDSNKVADIARRAVAGVQSGIGGTIKGAARAADLSLDVAPVQTFSGFGGVGLPVPPAVQKVNTQIEQDRSERSRSRQSRMLESLPYQLGKVIAEEAPTTFGVDPARDDEFMAKLAGAAGQMFPTLVAGALAGPVGVMAQYGAAAGEAQAEEAVQAGRPDLADVAFLNAAALGGLSEALIGVPGKFWAIVKGARTAGVKPNFFNKWVNKNPVTGGIVRAGSKGATFESGQEFIEQVGGNVIASDIAGYDPERKASKGAVEAAALGGVLGGVVGGAGAGLYKGHRNLTAKALRETREGPMNLRKVSMLPHFEKASAQPSVKRGPSEGYQAPNFTPRVEVSIPEAPATTEAVNQTVAEFAALEPVSLEELSVEPQPKEAPNEITESSETIPTPAGPRDVLIEPAGVIEPATTTEIAPSNPRLRPVPPEIPVKGIEVDPILIPQFKEDANPKTGEVRGEELKGSTYERPANPIVVWELLNGRRVVVTGRHRLALAQRLGEETIPATIVREADGFTQSKAITLDAEFNIRDGTGSVDDYATYFENTNISKTEATARGLLDRVKGKAAWDLAKSASDDLKALYKSGKISQEKTVAIARESPVDEATQRVGIKYALAGKPVDFIVNVMKASQAEAGSRSKTMDLFGSDDSAMKEMEERASLASSIQRDLADKVRAVQGAARAPAKAKELGVDVSDPEGLVKKVAEIKAEIQRWNDWPLHWDLVARVKGESFSLNKPESIEQQKARFADIAAKTAERSRKDKLDELARAPLKGTTGDLGQGDSLKPADDLFAPPTPKWTKATGESGFVLNPAVIAREIVRQIKNVGGYLKRAAGDVIDLAKQVKQEQFKVGKPGDYRLAKLLWVGRQQHSWQEAHEAQKGIRGVLKDPITDEAGYAWIEAAGDTATLQEWARLSKDPKRKAAYQRALTLTPTELDMVQAVRDTFAELGARAQAEGVLNTFKDNYVPHLWDLGSKSRSGGGRTLRERMTHSMARTIPTSFNGEQLGFIPKTKRLSEVVPIYINEMNRVIAARKFARDLRQGRWSDGEPLVQLNGQGVPVDGPEGQATLIFPDALKNKDLRYKVIPDQPALHDWIWAQEDTSGNPIYLKADMALHPAVVNDMKAILGKSGIKAWYQGDKGSATMAPIKFLVKNIDRAQSEYKRTMLGFFATFHQVQEATHGIGHRVGFLNRPKIDLINNPVHMDYATHGLMLYPDRASENDFREGFRHSGLVSRIPVIGQYADMYSDYLFHVFIPEMKLKTAEAIFKRNMHVFAKELGSGETSEAAVMVLSSEQTNAAYGHLNYTDLGRSPTIQHLLQLAFLAPDFLEARTRFAVQAAKGVVGAKVGREQALALGFLAVSQAVLAWLAAAMVGGEWDWRHPFEYRKGNRTYTMRSVPEDLMVMANDWRRFMFNRINPLVSKGAVMVTTGKDWRGENVDTGQIIQELAQGWIPLSVRPFVTDTKSPLGPWEQFAGTAGFKISYYSSVAKVFTLAREWKKNSGDPKLVAEAKREQAETHLPSNYTPMRRALENNEAKTAKTEYEKLLKTKTRIQVREAMAWNKPLTGSRKNERKFVESLTDKQKATYALALNTRKLIFNRFLKMRAGKSNLNEEEPVSKPEVKPGIADVPPIEP